MSRGGPKNMVVYDGDKRSSIRTYQDNTNNRQGFQIGWDINQSRKEDSKIATKIGQDSRNSYIPAYQAQTFKPAVEQKQDDEYLKQLYYEDLKNKQQIVQNGNHEPYNNYPDSLDQEYLNQYNQQQQQQQDEDLYQKYSQKMSNSGVKQNYNDQNQYNGSLQQQQAYNYQQQQQAYNPSQISQGQQQSQYSQQQQQQQQIGYNPQQQYTQQAPYGQQEDALSQFSQMHQNQPLHRQMAAKNKQSNIFNTDMQQDQDIPTRQSNRVTLKKKEMDDTQYKGYGNFYNKSQNENVPIYKEQKFVNRNKIDNQIFPKY